MVKQFLSHEERNERRGSFSSAVNHAADASYTKLNIWGRIFQGSVDVCYFYLICFRACNAWKFVMTETVYLVVKCWFQLTGFVNSAVHVFRIMLIAWPWACWLISAGHDYAWHIWNVAYIYVGHTNAWHYEIAWMLWAPSITSLSPGIY
jgi:hypothetical protein